MIAAMLLRAALAPEPVAGTELDGSGRVVGGAVALGVGYGSSLIAGSIQLASGDPNDRAMGWRLMLPGVGPFVAMPKMDPVQRWGSAVGGALQLGGVFALGWGLHRRRAHERGLQRRWLVDQRSRQGLAAFIGVFGATYLFTTMLGAMELNEAARTERIGRDDPLPQRRYGRRLLVPVGGPFLAIRHGREPVDRVLAGYMGGMQAATFAALVVGVALVSTARGRALRGSQEPRRLSVWPCVSPEGSTLRIAGRF